MAVLSTLKTNKCDQDQREGERERDERTSHKSIEAHFM